MSTLEDLCGRRFQRLLVIELAPERRKRAAYWVCRCDCGRVVSVRADVLKAGASRSCGCLRRERNTTHGLSKAHKRAYRKWAEMLQRCTNPKRSNWEWYGGRGLAVCRRWRKFENFFADMGDPPARASLERLDNSQGYSPDNCAWRTAKDQARNRRSNVLLTINNRTQCVSAWAEEYGVKRATISARIKLGWDPHRAVTVKPGGST